jgi:pimeloyl-ACP methyl ester carboxylesterase
MTGRVASPPLALAVAVAVVLVAAGCGGGSPDPPPGARAVTIETPDGARLDALELGEGPKVAIVSHGANGDRSGYFEAMPVLADAGWRVIAYDARDMGASTGPGQDRQMDLRAVVEHARETGAQTVALVGSSLGAMVSMSIAADLHADAVVSLSGFPDGAGPQATAEGLRGIDVYLAVSADDEPYASETRALAEALGVEADLVDGEEHGTGLFDADPALAERIAAFLDGVG